MKRIIALYGHAECGKSTTINILRELIWENGKSISSNVAGYIFDYLSINVSRAEAIDFAINLYVNFYSYNLADDYYDNMIDPILSEMTESQLVSLIDGSDRNSQIYDRRKFTSSRFRIKEALSKKNPQFDYSPYTNFNR